LIGSYNNGVNGVGFSNLDVAQGPLGLNGNPGNGQPYFNTALFSVPTLGSPGSASRRMFYGPGLNNWDIALLKETRFSESKVLEFRMETFHTFNHAQFFGANSVDGNINDSTFGQVAYPSRRSFQASDHSGSGNQSRCHDACGEPTRVSIRGVAKGHYPASLSLVRRRFSRCNQPQRMGRVEIEVLGRRRRRWLASFEGCDSLPDLVVTWVLGETHTGNLGRNGCHSRGVGCNPRGGISLSSRSRSHEVVDCAL